MNHRNEIRQTLFVLRYWFIIRETLELIGIAATIATVWIMGR
jgi:hypothetical protein